VHDGFFGKDKSPEGLQRAKEARREFAGLMATTAVLAGALGMPFANAFAGVYNTLMSDRTTPRTCASRCASGRPTPSVQMGRC
jgi:hypothetical protein